MYNRDEFDRENRGVSEASDEPSDNVFTQAFSYLRGATSLANVIMIVIYGGVYYLIVPRFREMFQEMKLSFLGFSTFFVNVEFSYVIIFFVCFVLVVVIKDFICTRKLSQAINFFSFIIICILWVSLVYSLFSPLLSIVTNLN